MTYQIVQAQKTYWVQARIAAETGNEAIDLINSFDIDWETIHATEDFSGVFWTTETGLVNDPKNEVLRLSAIIKRLKDEFNIEADWAN